MPWNYLNVRWLLEFMSAKHENLTVVTDVVTENAASEKIIRACGFEETAGEETVNKGRKVTARSYVLSIQAGDGPDFGERNPVEGYKIMNDSGKETVLAYISAINEHDIDKIYDLMSENYLFVDT